MTTRSTRGAGPHGTGGVTHDHLVEALSDPAAWPDHSGAEVELRQTHISVVFLVGSRAYKIRKPIRLDFLDFSSPSLREEDCRRELELNRRLAPGVYLGIEEVRRGRDGRLRMGGEGETVEHAVVMARLPDQERLSSMLEAGSVNEAFTGALASLLARFHRDARKGPDVSRHARHRKVSAEVREAVQASSDQAGRTVSPRVFERFRQAIDSHLAEQRSLMEQRAGRDVPREGHGDLRLEHVYLHEGSILILDCIEFNEALRCLDPVADLAFLVMELRGEGRADLADHLARTYLDAADDPEGFRLLPLYTAYRAAVRARVNGLKLESGELTGRQRERVAGRARALWLLGLGQVEPPRQRPGLLLVGGLPGTGKSTLARTLGGSANFTVIRSDRIRREIAGDQPGRYSERWTGQVYRECLSRARRALLEGGRVIVDATFRKHAHRQDFLRAAGSLCVPALFLHCRASEEIVRHRLERRTGDLSEADWSVFVEMRERWEEPDAAQRRLTHPVPAGGSRKDAVQAAETALKGAGLV